MKIIDCFMFFNEDFILDIRLNELDQYVDKFVIVESNFTHSGDEKKFNFQIEKYSKFRDKIIYIKITDKPKNLIEIYKSDTKKQLRQKKIINSLILENYQRNCLQNAISQFDNNDFILISDVDEIPNFKLVDLNKNKNFIIIFEQYFFHYKLNLYLKNFFFYGSKGCLKKNLKSPQWLRNVKNKKYSLFRLDTLFSDKKYQNVKIIKKGGWHFTNVMNEDKILYKIKSYLHHADFPEELLNKETFEKLILDKQIMYDHSVDKNQDRFRNKKQLDTFEKKLLPTYILNNYEKFKDWLV